MTHLGLCSAQCIPHYEFEEVICPLDLKQKTSLYIQKVRSLIWCKMRPKRAQSRVLWDVGCYCSYLAFRIWRQILCLISDAKTDPKMMWLGPTWSMAAVLPHNAMDDMGFVSLGPTHRKAILCFQRRGFGDEFQWHKTNENKPNLRPKNSSMSRALSFPKLSPVSVLVSSFPLWSCFHYAFIPFIFMCRSGQSFVM